MKSHEKLNNTSKYIQTNTENSVKSICNERIYVFIERIKTQLIKGNNPLGRGGAGSRL